MIAVAAALLPILAPVFLIAGLGFGWVRAGLAYDADTATDLVSRVGAPCLIFSTLATLDSPAGLAGEVALAAAVMILGAMALGLVLLPLAGLDRRAFLAPMMFTNSGNMGLSICLFAFGPAGLELGVVYFTVISALHFTLGVLIWSGTASPWALLRTPFPYAVGLGLVPMLTGLEAPAWALNTTSLLGGIAIPLMLFTLGATIARLRIARPRQTARATALKFALGIGLAVAVCEGLGLEGTARGVVLIQGVLPTAAFAALFAQRYDRDPAGVGSLVLATTVVSMVALPVLFSLILEP